MKPLVLLAALAWLSPGAATAAQPPADCVPDSLNIPGAPYPCLFPDHRVLFRVSAPDARKVVVRLGKGVELTRAADGPWYGTSTPQQFGIRNVGYESPGTAHEWLTWRRCFRAFALLLFR